MATDSDRRQLKTRWTVTADLTLTTASQIGSHAADNCDMTFEQDEKGRVPLHGTTLAGALRNAVADHLVGYRKSENMQVERLFGSLSLHESPLMVFDTYSRNEQAVTASIRDGVRIEADTRRAQDKYKYDREIALPGLVFPIRLDLLVGENMDERELVSALLLALDALCPVPHRPGTHLGARRTRGLGAVQANSFRARRYDLKQPDDWKALAGSDYGVEPLTANYPEQSSPAESIRKAWPGFQVNPIQDARRFLRMDCEFALKGSLLIRSPGQQVDSADMIQLTEAGKQIFSGTSLAGALRSQAARIINTINPLLNPHGDPLAGDIGSILLNEMFGMSPEKTREGDAKGSRVRVTECAIVGNWVHRQARVKIDRFTGGALDTALFDEEPALAGTVSFQVWVLNPADSEIALMLFVLRDVIEGLLTFGGEASIGRGVLQGDVQVTLPGEHETFALSQVTDDAAHLTQLQQYADHLRAQLMAG